MTNFKIKILCTFHIKLTIVDLFFHSNFQKTRQEKEKSTSFLFSFFNSCFISGRICCKFWTTKCTHAQAKHLKFSDQQGRKARTSYTGLLAASITSTITHRLLFFFFCDPSYISGVHYFWWDFCIFVSNPTIEVVTCHLHQCCMLGVFLLLAFTCLGHECHDLLSPCYCSLYSYLKEFWGNGVRNHVNPKGKIPSTGGSEEVQIRSAASHRTASPAHYQLSYSGPHTRVVQINTLKYGWWIGSHWHKALLQD